MGFARAHTGINTKILSMACGLAVALFFGVVLAAKWLSKAQQSTQETGQPEAAVGGHVDIELGGGVVHPAMTMPEPARLPQRV